MEVISVCDWLVGQGANKLMPINISDRANSLLIGALARLTAFDMIMLFPEMGSTSQCMREQKSYGFIP
jgi:hypothetical protein